MCMGVPCRVLTVTPGTLPMARVDVAGAEQDVCLAYLPERRWAISCSSKAGSR